MYKRMSSFLFQVSILNRGQYGFRPSFGTNDAFINFMNYTYDRLNNSQYVLALFLDYFKAFNSIKILKNLYHYGFRDCPYKGFESHLNNREQFIEYASIQKNVKKGCSSRAYLGISVVCYLCE